MRLDSTCDAPVLRQDAAEINSTIFALKECFRVMRSSKGAGRWRVGRDGGRGTFCSRGRGPFVGRWKNSRIFKVDKLELVWELAKVPGSNCPGELWESEPNPSTVLDQRWACEAWQFQWLGCGVWHGFMAACKELNWGSSGLQGLGQAGE